MLIIFPLLPQSKQRARQIKRAYYISLASPVQTKSKADQTCLLYFHCSLQTESKVDQTCLLYFPCFLSPNREQGKSDVPIIFPLLLQSKQRARQIRRAYYIFLASPDLTEIKANQTCLLYFPCSPVQTESKADKTCLLYFPCFSSPNREQGRSDVPIIFPLLPQSKQRARQIRRAYYISLASPVQTESKVDQMCLLYFHCFPSPNREQGRSDVPIILPLLPQSKQRARQIRRAYYISLASPVQTESKADQTCLLYFPCFSGPYREQGRSDVPIILPLLPPNREQGRSDVPILFPLLPQSKQRARQI